MKREELDLTSHKTLAMRAARRMATTTNKARTVKTWAKHMLAVIGGEK